MKSPASHVLLLVLFIRDFCHGTILCSECNLKESPNCENKPPEAQPCHDSGDGVPQTCSVVRIYQKETGKLIDFRRSCATTEQGGCFDDPIGRHICAEICSTDRCNGPSSGCTVAASHVISVVAVVAGLILRVKDLS